MANWVVEGFVETVNDEEKEEIIELSDDECELEVIKGTSGEEYVCEVGANDGEIDPPVAMFEVKGYDIVKLFSRGANEDDMNWLVLNCKYVCFFVPGVEDKFPKLWMSL